MWRRVYSFLITLLAPWALWRLGRQSLRQTGLRESSRERLGYIEPQRGPTFWIHASSLGEVQVALSLIRSLRERDPDLPIVLTTFTATGKEKARGALSPTIPVALLPLDRMVWVNRFLDRLGPNVGIVIETEIWPNLAHACWLRAIPLVLVNAQLSERTTRRFLRFQRLFSPVFRNLALVLAQSEIQRRHFIRLGTDPDRIRVCGNLKYDMSVSAETEERGQALRSEFFASHPVWIAGSTRVGEDAVILDAHLLVARSIPDVILVLAPRHPDRVRGIVGEIRLRKLPVALRSLGERPEPGGILLLDTVGELTAFYAAGDVAFVGGSLVPSGGHNPLEAVLHRRPVIMGPFQDNVQEIARHLSEAKALDTVQDAPDLARVVGDLLRDPLARAERALRGLGAAQASRQALTCTLQALWELWPPRLPEGSETPRFSAKDTGSGNGPQRA